MSKQSQDDNYDYLFKMVIIGDSGVGKSCIISRFAFNEYNNSIQSTVGVSFSVKTVKIDGKNIKLQIWDTAGQEKFGSVTTAYYRGAVGALLVYDISNRSSFKKLESWLTKLKEGADSNIQVILIGNKSDLKQSREVSTEEAKEFSEKHNLSFIETSALDSSNVSMAFNDLLSKIYNFAKNNPTDNNEDDSIKDISRSDRQPSQQPQKKSGCC